MKFLLFLLFISCTTSTNQKQLKFTQKDILNELEKFEQETYHFFIDLEHPYFFTAGSRLTLYADEKRWAIVFEKSGYSTGNSSGEIEFAYFGNCLKNLESKEGDNSTSNMQNIIIIENPELERISDDFELVSKEIKKIKVRDTFLPIQHNLSEYKARNISQAGYENSKGLVDVPSLIRYLDEEHPNIFRSTDIERRKCLPSDLPQIMQINQWHHQWYYQGKGTKPSEYETYKMIADILVSRDSTKWKPTLKPNNDWRNWPKAGFM